MNAMNMLGSGVLLEGFIADGTFGACVISKNTVVCGDTAFAEKVTFFTSFTA